MNIFGCQDSQITPEINNKMIIPRQVFDNDYLTFIPENLYGDQSIAKDLKKTARTIATFEIPQIEFTTRITVETNGYLENQVTYIDSLPSILTIESNTSPFVTRITRITYFNGDVYLTSKGNIKATIVKKYVSMPNVASIAKEVFNSRRRTSIIVGLPNNSGMWVDIRTANNFIGSIYTHRSNMYHGQVYYTGFDYDPHRSILRGKKSIVLPEWYSNKLFAEILMYKFNTKASQLGITPTGFGNDSIMRRADSMMTLWKNYSRIEYESLYINIFNSNRKYNFGIDTISIKPLRIIRKES